jgi:riboflavin synthase
VSAIGEGPSVVIRLAIPPELRPYLVARGFVAVDDASLTVMRLRPDGCDVSLVYHTQQGITLPSKRPGAPVNVEVDVVGKYVERLVASEGDQGVTLDLLRRTGFA